MNRLAVLLGAYLLTGLDLGLRDGMQLGPTRIAPSFLLPFVALIAMFAPPAAAVWTGLLIGLAVDLSTLRGPMTLVIAGPHALGYAVAAYVVIVLRTIVFRRNALTLAVLSIIAAAAANLVAFGLLGLRSVYGDPIGFRAGEELVQRVGSSLATGLSALLLSLVLFPLLPLFGFNDPQARRFSRREP